MGATIDSADNAENIVCGGLQPKVADVKDTADQGDDVLTGRFANSGPKLRANNFVPVLGSLVTGFERVGRDRILVIEGGPDIAFRVDGQDDSPGAFKGAGVNCGVIDEVAVRYDTLESSPWKFDVELCGDAGFT